VSGINGKCKHVAALATYVNQERTDGCTDNVQQWQKPSQHKQSLYPKGETIESLFGLDPVTPPSFEKNDVKLNNFAQLLASNNETNGMFYKAVTCQPIESEIVAQSVICDEQKLQMIYDDENNFHSMVTVSSGTKTIFKKMFSTLSEEEKTFYNANVEKSQTECCHTFKNTLGQATNPNWFLQRKMRISASKAHKILRGKKLETRLKYFFESPPLTKGMSYGRDMEKKAREHYSKITGKHVIESGLLVRANQTWLCSSPDGLIKDEKICLEIKCPSSCENLDISVDYIKNENLVKSHPYFTQVQIQMYTSNSDFCHFFVFSEKDFILINVPRDKDFL